MAGLADHEVTAPAQDPYRLGLDERASCGAVVGVDLDQPVLRLRHDLLGDDEAVAVEEGGVLCGGGVGDERRERVVGSDLGDAVDRDEREGLHGGVRQPRRARRAPSAAATRASVIRVSAATACTPSASISPAARRVTGVDDQRAAEGAVLAGHPDARDVDPERTHQTVGRPLHGTTGDDRAHPDHTVTTGDERVADAGHCEDRADRDHRVARAHEDGFGVVQRVEHAGSRGGLIGAVEAHVHHGRFAAFAYEPLLHGQLGGAGRARGLRGDAGGDPVVTHGQQPGLEVPGRGDSGGRLAERVAGHQALGAEEVRGEVPVAQSEPGVGAVPVEGVDRGEGLPGQAPSGVGVLRTGQRVGHGIEVGTDEEPVEPVVVGGVHDDGDLGRVHHLHQSAEEACRPHPARERRDHCPSVPGAGSRHGPVCPGCR